MKKRPLRILFLVLILGVFGLGYLAYSNDKIQNIKPVINLTKNNQAPAPPKENTSSNTLVAVGDMMLSRNVGTKIRAAGDVNSPFLKTAAILQNADITFGNLESPFYDQGKPVTEGMVFKAEPDTIGGLVYAGFDIVSLCNNHFGNQGQKGEQYTFSLLLKNNIQYVGAGETAAKARELNIIEKNGIKFGFLGYDDMISTYTPQSYQATIEKPGVNPLVLENVKADVKKAKEQVDVVVVTFHWGTEYKTVPNQQQIDIAHTAIDSGASLIIGHHPHVAQYFETKPYEKYQDGYIFYSLGNFVFDQMWSENTRKGLVAKVQFKGKNIEKVDAIPITIYDYFQPKPD